VWRGAEWHSAYPRFGGIPSRPTNLRGLCVLRGEKNLMKRVTTFLISLFLLASCVPTPTAPAVPDEPTATLLAPTLTATSIPPSATPLPTATPVPCDPLAADFCIVAGHFVFQRPILPPANDSVEETYRFASTASGTREAHHGVEFENASGTPVHAVADGEVIFAGPDTEAVYSPWKNFYGNIIVLRHADDLFTLYAHLSRIEVEAGQTVTVGQVIGEVGKSGTAQGSHLHFEVRRGKDYFSTLNPELWLAPRTEEGVLAISVTDAQGKFQWAKITVQSDAQTYFIETYDAEMRPLGENAALGGLKPGRYRIALVYGGQVYERWVEVELGRLTQVAFVVK
jgi:hypothetical protein